MALWETISEAQVKKQPKTKFKENGEEIEIKTKPNGWYKDFESVS